MPTRPFSFMAAMAQPPKPYRFRSFVFLLDYILRTYKRIIVVISLAGAENVTWGSSSRGFSRVTEIVL